MNTPVIQYPLRKRREFVLLGLSVAWFVASFFIAGQCSTMEIAGAVFAANLICVAGFMMYRATRFRDRETRDAQRVGEIATEVTPQEVAIIESKHIPCTLHRFDVWPKGAPARFPRYWAQFPDDDSKMLFMLARPAHKA